VEQLVRGAATEQLTLDGSNVGGSVRGSWEANRTTANWSDAERAADAARSRFGSAAVRLATLLETPARSGRGETQLFPESGNQIG
jgi:hypothetical protein